MRTTTTIAAGAAMALLLTVGGCSTGAVVESSVAPPTAPTADPAPSASSEQEPSDSAETTASPGVYVDYYDGAIAETAGLKVLFFHASWCPKCRALDADIEANAVPDGMTIFKVDFDTATALRQQYGVTLQTTIVYVDDDGDLLTKGVLYEDTTLAALVAVAP